MPRVTKIQTNFSGGEISPRLYGRVDSGPYANGAEALENVIPLIQGGARRRDGWLFVEAAKNALQKARVLPFVFSSVEAYILELGHQYLRFYKDDARLGAPYEVATPYTEAQLFEVDFVQNSDTMVMLLKDVHPQRLRRFGDTNWTIDNVPFEIMPFAEIGHSFSVTLTLSAATVGAARTATASAGVFQNGDVGREIVYQGGTFKITGFTSTTVVTGDITSAFPSVNVPADVWTLTGTPQGLVTPSAKDPLETVITLTETTAPTPINIWRAADVGKWVRINGGLVQITAYTSATEVSGKIKQILTATVAAPANSWTLEAAVWSAANGWPRAGTFHQQRLTLGGSPAFPQTFWGSAVGAYLDFMLGALDSDAYAYTLDSDQINPIMHLASTRILFAFTFGGEFTAKGGVEKPITPTNVQVESESAYGCSEVKPVRAGKEMVYVDASGTQVLAFNYDASDEDYDAEDLTFVAEHITHGPIDPVTNQALAIPIVDLSYQRRPDPLLWAPRADGQCPTLSIAKRNEVLAWARQITDGAVESVATIPRGSGYQTWAVIRRTVNGATVRYIERSSPSVLVDSAIVGTNAAGQSVLPVPHLIGKTVQCVADGRYMGTFVVSASGGGQITLPRTAKAWSIGLPYTSRIKMLPPEIETGVGSAQGNAMSTHEVALRLIDSYACHVNGHEVRFRKHGDSLLDKPLQAFSGVKRIDNLGWALGDSPIEITSDLPLPFHVAAVIRKLTVNQG